MAVCLYRLGDTAISLLKAGAETDKKDIDGYLAIELAPDSQVNAVKPIHRTCSTDLRRSVNLF
jgi:26S proteasome non-ATPase regulatory subunit 10